MPLADITTIEQLHRNLNMGPGYGGYAELVKAIKLPKKEWEGFTLWKKERYSRNCLVSCDSYEMLLVCWLANQSSPIHSYDFQEGWIKVLEGELTIETYLVNKKDKTASLKETIQLKKGESTYLNDSMGFHKVYTKDKKSVSLHLHIEKVKRWEEFDPNTKQFKITVPHYDNATEYCE